MENIREMCSVSVKSKMREKGKKGKFQNMVSVECEV